MCIVDYETNIGGQGPVRAVELLGRKKKIKRSRESALDVDTDETCNYRCQQIF
jgi:hypothetical protein